MLRSLLATTAIIAMTISLAQTASAATQEYQLSVQVSVTIAPKSVVTGRAKSIGADAGLPVTVSCAVGPAPLALASGAAVNASGTGSATANLKRGAGTGVFTLLVPVTLTAPDASKPANTYLCWTVVNKSALAPSVQTPVNFVTGKVANADGTPITSEATDTWDTVQN